MDIVSFRPEIHGDMIRGWWQAHGWPALPDDALPKSGLIVVADGVPAVAGFMYMTDSSWGVLEFIVGNKDVSKDTRKQALDVLIPGLLTIAKEHGKRLVFSSVSHPSLIDGYKRHGMIETDKGMTNFVWRAQ